MAVALISGSGGLIGSECVRHFASAGYDVIGLDNDMRALFFGPESSTAPTTSRMLAEFPSFRALDVDVRDRDAVMRIFRAERGRIELVIHTAAQPSHDWAALEPRTDFSVNAVGTLNLLEACREHADAATFVFTSTNKVYGDTPNRLPLVELETRLDLPRDHPWYDGVDLSMSIDQSLHSLFGVSKVAADLLVQEYGRYFGLPTVAFRCGCLTGPNHAGAQLHGFLSYLLRCIVRGEHYTVLGYGGKQVRDNIHSADVARAFEAFHASPRAGAVYNLGGGRESNCSVLEAIEICEEVTGRQLDWSLDDRARVGDHRWWISDLSAFKHDYPDWSLGYDIRSIVRDIHERNAERWAAAA